MATRKRIASGFSPFEEANFGSGNVAGPSMSSFETKQMLESIRKKRFSRPERTAAAVESRGRESIPRWEFLRVVHR